MALVARSIRSPRYVEQLDMGYVCTFRGRRDSYQVPVALAEAGQLDCFITDHYRGSLEAAISRLLPIRLSEKLSQRWDADIPLDRVQRLRIVAAAEEISRIAGRSASQIYELFDPMYGEAAARTARRFRSDLFMYSPHAWSAFRARYKHAPHKVLFQFHPHYELENAILAADGEGSTRAGIRFAGDLENTGESGVLSRRRSDEAWKLADHIVCASSFTSRSLMEAGAPRSKITVVPYGVERMPDIESLEPATRNTGFNALFVGSGLQRKGLHHLLMAWQKARLLPDSKLTIVARVVDPGLRQLLAATRRVDYLAGVNGAELHRLYSKASLFVMPSLVEGFGQVYLEALSHGLPILGTPNTCCPDLGSETEGVYVSSVGNVDELVSWLETLSQKIPGDRDIRQRARRCAEKFTWSMFRQGIRGVAANSS